MAAKLECEICGGKLIGKPGGIFECDSCGMEYSTEWAKAKIQEIRGTVKVEGTVEVTGKVQVEGGTMSVTGSSDDVVQWKTLVQTYMDAFDYDEADATVKKILAAAPEDAFANEVYRKLRDMKNFEVENGILIKYHGKAEEVEIPRGIREIGPQAFTEHRKLKRVIIPGSVRVIDWCAFGDEMMDWGYCLESVVMEEGVEEIRYAAFGNCGKLREIQLPSSLRTIDKSAFKHSGLHNIKIPEGFTEIENEVFEGCKDLKTVELPQSLKRIDGDAFKDSGVTEITIPDGIEEIGGGAFYGCDALWSVQLPASLDKIGGCAFASCKRLTDVTQTAAVLRACEEERGPFCGTPFGDHRFREAQTRRWQAQGLCAHCGSEFKGIIMKRCIRCNAPKDY